MNIVTIIKMPNDNTNTNNSNQTNDVPQVFSEDVLPPMPQENMIVTQTVSAAGNDQTKLDTPLVDTKEDSTKELGTNTDSGSAAPSGDINLPPVVIGTTPKKKFGSGKVIATILGLFLLVGGLGTGTYLVQQNQNIEERAGACGGGCGPGMQCAGDLNGDGTGECVPRGTTDQQISDALNGGGGLNSIGGVQSSINTNGTYNTGTNTNSTSWNQWQEAQGGATVASQNCNALPGLEFLCGTGLSIIDHYPNLPAGYSYSCNTSTDRCSVTGPGCTNGICGEFRVAASTGGGGGGGGNNPTPTPPSITASCQNVKAYSSTWTSLTSTQLSQLKTGDNINFCVTGTATGGSFNKAKFTINGVVQAETTTVRPSSTDFCQSYVIPSGVTTFNVSAQINHVTLGWK